MIEDFQVDVTILFRGDITDARDKLINYLKQLGFTVLSNGHTRADGKVIVQLPKEI